MTTCADQTQMAELFGISFEEMDKILIEHGLKSGELATQKAIDNDCVYLFFRGNSLLSQDWNILKISELTGMKLQDEIGFHVGEVMSSIQFAGEQADYDYALLLATQAYRDVPEELWDEVHKCVEREIFGDRRQACGKCGRMTFWRIEDFCWRCLPDAPFVEQRLDYEAAIREVASELAANGWGTLYADYRLEPKDTDIVLWNGAVDTAIDAFLARLVTPSKFDKKQAVNIFYEFVEGQVTTEFVYNGYEDHGIGRCYAFLELAYKTVASMLTKEAA